MRQKELRLALVCYGGISLAVYMHGITKEVWRLARASRAFHAGEAPADGSEAIYHRLLAEIEAAAGVRLRVLADIVAGASAGGINGVFLAQAIATGQSLEPLTQLWLDAADVDRLLAPATGTLAGMARLVGRPLGWAAAGRVGGAIEADVDPAVRGEVRAKLARFLGAPWFAPPFGGEGFTALLLDAFEAMAAAPCGAPLLPPGQPLDLFVTVTDFHGHPERLRLHSPPEVLETEHRLVIGFSNRTAAGLGDAAGLVFAARATASFPGAFPPFAVGELDRVLVSRNRPWPDRDAFLARALPPHFAAGAADRAMLIDGSVLANAPFRPAIEALRDRPAAREVDRRFVYIDPKPGIRSVRPSADAAPGFFRTIFGALSDIPREQPIRDNLDAIEARSRRIARTRAIVASIRPEVEAAIEEAFGRTFFLDRPTPARLAAWRTKANAAAARQAGFAHAGYEQLKLAGIVEDMATLLAALAGRDGSVERIADALAAHLAAIGLIDRTTPPDAADRALLLEFLRQHDLGFRIRRLRALAARLEEAGADAGSDPAAIEAMRDAIYHTLSRYLEREGRDWFVPEAAAAAAHRAPREPAAALAAIARARDLKPIDDAADAAIADALGRLDKRERRILLLAYLGFPFDDIAVLPLLQSVGRDEFNPIQVDRIAPDDAAAIRAGGAEATLKGIRFNSFGAFFARAYRENDYLWGRLHGAERLIDIVVSTLPAGAHLPPGRVVALRKKAFRAILAEERERLTAIPEVIAAIAQEVG